MASEPRTGDRFQTANADDDPFVEPNEWVRFAMRQAISATLHPFEYAKVLMQLGYEPVPPVPGTSLFGENIQVLPNIFRYAGYIRRVDGFFGWYRGLTPKLMGSVVSLWGSERIVDYFGLTVYDDKNTKTDADLYIQFKVNLKRDVVLTAAGIVIAHPFHVISIRMMSQFIGRETLYRSLLSSIVEIFENEGPQGFFAGLMPKLMCDVACVILTSSTVFLLNKYVIKDKVGRAYSAGFAQFAFASILYPLQVVSTCMAVTGSRLVAGRPPIMPEYRNWIDCWNDLQSRGELKRGNSFFWRRVPAPPKNHFADYPLLPKVVKYY